VRAINSVMGIAAGAPVARVDGAAGRDGASAGDLGVLGVVSATCLSYSLMLRLPAPNYLGQDGPATHSHPRLAATMIKALVADPR
jgi:hypothetical protein